MIDLYTARTPNGFKVAIVLEELGLPYETHPIRLEVGEQLQAWYREISPDGKIPAIVDRDEGNFRVFESGAILLYLAEKTGKLIPSDPKGRSVVIQWLMFQMAGIGPMQGQANVFYRYATEKIPFAIGRYQRETRRLYEVLNRQLERHEYIAGDYSIADIAAWPWVKVHDWAGVSVEGLAHLERWLALVGEREAVRRGLKVPPKDDPASQGFRTMLKEFQKKTNAD